MHPNVEKELPKGHLPTLGLEFLIYTEGEAGPQAGFTLHANN